MTAGRPDIPAQLKRAVRQRCGFGCVICGSPIYEYDHVEGYAQVLEHTEDNIVLLCPSHHSEKTKGLLTASQVRAFATKPASVEKGMTAPFGLHFDGSGPQLEATFGGNSVVMPCDGQRTDLFPIIVDGLPLLTLSVIDGRAFVSMDIRSQGGQPVLAITDNELVLNATAFDIEFVGQHLTIRDSPGSILARLRFDPPNRIEIIQGRFVANGVELLVSESGFVRVGHGRGDGHFGRCRGNGPAGFIFGENPRGLMGFHWERNPPRREDYYLFDGGGWRVG